ncbi:hypothetical protein BKA57DRAFT_466412 [Linnemannia elongata]|nr:hypothetical protein BKA57DRAFT_466412 [Linnemannia elongata]
MALGRTLIMLVAVMAVMLVAVMAAAGDSPKTCEDLCDDVRVRCTNLVLDRHPECRTSDGLVSAETVCIKKLQPELDECSRAVDNAGKRCGGGEGCASEAPLPPKICVGRFFIDCF